MPVIRFQGWETASGASLTQNVRLVTYQTGAKHITSGVTRFEPGATIPLHYHNVEEQVTIIEGEAVAIVHGERHVLHAWAGGHCAAS